MDWLAKLPTMSDTALAALHNNAKRISTEEASTAPQPLAEKGKRSQAPKAAIPFQSHAQIIATAGEILPAIEAELAMRRTRRLQEMKARPKIAKPPRAVVDYE